MNDGVSGGENFPPARGEGVGTSTGRFGESKHIFFSEMEHREQARTSAPGLLARYLVDRGSGVRSTNALLTA